MTLTLLLIIFGTTVQSDSRSVALKKAPAPELEILDGYNRGHCIFVPYDVRVCKQLSDDQEVLVIEKNRKQVGLWPVSADMGETSDFEALSADLDHDGRAELIVANHDGTSNGMAIDFWTISIFPDANFTTVAEPLTFSVEEYGSFGTFVAHNRGVSILTTRWVGLTDPKGKRGDGLYLVGHWWRYQSGELAPQTNRPTLARRYLTSFAYERGDTSGSDRVPYRWLKSPRAEHLKPEQITGASSRSEAGVIQAVSALTKTGSERTVKISFSAAGGSPVVYTYPKIDASESRDHSLDFIADAASGRIYPIRYFPSRIEAWLTGKRATLRTYGEGPQAETILWLER